MYFIVFKSQHHFCPIMELNDRDRFEQLSVAEQTAYRQLLHQMVRLAQACSVPIFFSPPVSAGGKINGASGAVLKLSAGTFLITASHVD